MKTKPLMTISSLFLATIGIFISFLPKEIAEYVNIEANNITLLFLKILGALYMGFGILNWMAKGTLIGGIYNRPIVFGNIMHFGVGAVALAKVMNSIQEYTAIIIALTIIYAIFALLFIYLFKINPTQIEK
ncbi:hypothetical protein ACG2LH_13250 [Zhouia sp. PK063]|uniref:hypothetical protein n=1 Tax=Zhouia sp. PK063 TaxID=3373602 RepID=UPI0037A04B30